MGRRRSDGISSARSPAKLSDVTKPHATSSPSPFSTSLRNRPVALTRSPKNDAPRPSSVDDTQLFSLPTEAPAVEVETTPPQAWDAPTETMEAPASGEEPSEPAGEY